MSVCLTILNFWGNFCASPLVTEVTISISPEVTISISPYRVKWQAGKVFFLSCWPTSRFWFFNKSQSWQLKTSFFITCSYQQVDLGVSMMVWRPSWPPWHGTHNGLSPNYFFWQKLCSFSSTWHQQLWFFPLGAVLHSHPFFKFSRVVDILNGHPFHNFLGYFTR
jgi:hypothetical protein